MSDGYRDAARKQDQARALAQSHQAQRNHFIGDQAVNQIRHLIREDDERQEREEAQALRLKHPLHLIRT